jgi:hypothetical protein
VVFSTEKDAIHAAALMLRGRQYVWLIEGPGVRYTAKEIEERCKPLLQVFKGKT